MNYKSTSYSPNILIFLEIGKTKVRLADVLYQSAMLYETVTLPPGTRADLVFQIDGVEEREGVMLDSGISEGDAQVNFSYINPGRVNGRHFPV